MSNAVRRMVAINVMLLREMGHIADEPLTSISLSSSVVMTDMAVRARAAIATAQEMEKESV